MKVSICIPAYKQPDFLKRCLNSILEQDFSDYEIIITDDSPNDVLTQLVGTYTDERIRYYKNEKPLGSPRNWNEAIRKAKGEYIKILHHDDWFSKPESLRAFVNLLDTNPDVDIAFSACCNADNSRGNKELHVVSGANISRLKQNPRLLLLGNILGAPSVCIFRNNKDYMFTPELIWLVDTDFYIRVAQRHSFAYTPDILINVGVSEHQITQSELTNYKVRISEKIHLYNKYSSDKSSPAIRRSLLRALGREKIINNAGLKRELPDVGFSFSNTDMIVAYFYFIKKKIGSILKQ